MARFKDFDAAEAERKGEPITFRLGGREWVIPRVKAGPFMAFARLQAEANAARSADLSADEMGPIGIRAMLSFNDYIASSLRKDQRAKYNAMLETADVSFQTIMDVAMWMVEQATGNPTEDASPLPVAPPNTGQPPRRFSLAPVSTPEDSASAAG